MLLFQTGSIRTAVKNGYTHIDKHSGFSVWSCIDLYRLRLSLNFVWFPHSSWLPAVSLQDCNPLREFKLGYIFTFESFDQKIDTTDIPTYQLLNRMEKLFSALYLNFLVFPSIQNTPMRDLDDEVLNGNIGNPTWHLCLLPTPAKDCMLSFQLSCNQIPTNRQTLWRQWGAFLSVFLFTSWITTKAMQSQSIGCAFLRGREAAFSIWKECSDNFRIPP